MDVLLQNKPDLLIENIQAFSWKEIKTHNNQDDCWIVIDQFVYDITPWIKKHPGGNAFTILAGEDASAMFYSNHFNTSKNQLQKFLIGTVKEHEPLFSTYEDKFFITLKHRVRNYFKENNIDYRNTAKNIRMIIFTGLLLLVSWCCMYLLPPWGMLAAVPMGLATSSLIGSFGHEQIHGNLFPRLAYRRGYRVINNILWGLFIPFMPERYFQYEHIRHHNYPMHPEHDRNTFPGK